MPHERARTGLSTRAASSSGLPSREEFAATIHHRITARLGRRVRNLGVTIEAGVIRLHGECSTYYSKQLAQHAALGVVEDEEIDNAIEVTMGR